MELLKPERGEIFNTSPSSLTPLHQVLICGTHVHPQLRQFWNTLRQELSAKGPYKASIGGMRLRLQELQEEDLQTRRIRAEKPEGWEDTAVLYHQGLPYVLEIISTELISSYHDDPLAGHFVVKKTRELIARKYYWETIRLNVEAYVKGWSVCLSSEAVRHKSYGDLQLLPIRTHRWKDLFRYGITHIYGLEGWQLRLDPRHCWPAIKTVHIEPVQVVIITAPALAEAILDGLSSSTAVTTHAPPTKKTLNPSQSPKQQMS